MKATRRTQPLRSQSARAQGPALQAAQRGRSALRYTPAEIRRQAMKKRSRKRYRGRRDSRHPIQRILGLRRNLSP